MKTNRDVDPMRPLRPEVVLDWPDHRRLLLETAPDDEAEPEAVTA